MKVLAVLFAAIGVSAGWLGMGRPEPWKVAVTGDLHGYLAPCGCSSPMIGGIRRRATALASLGKPLLVLDNGGFIKEPGRQSEFKAEAAAEAIALSGVSAINLAWSDADLGRGTLLNISQLSEGKLISTHLSERNDLELPRWVEVGPFLVGGVTERASMMASLLDPNLVDADRAVKDLALEATKRGKIPILLVSGSLEMASKLVESTPEVSLAVYSSKGDPAATPIKVGKTVMLTAGDRGRNLVTATYRTEFVDYASIRLGPELKDDPDVAEIYSSYLKRVEDADLISLWPRTETAEFSGNRRCGSCHAKAQEVWSASKHRIALKTLEDGGHAKDPDCVACHVVGLSSTKGFRSRETTPDLTDVGCESCHGPGEKHSLAPLIEKMVKVGEKSCVPCHTSENSPNFDFEGYWEKIKH